MKKLALLLAPTIFIASCAPAYNPQTATPDADLSCTEITQQLAKAATVRSEAQSNKGVSAQNIGWALFFWPGIFLNEANNNQIIQKIDDRVDTLNRLYATKGCKAAAPASTNSAPATDPAPPSK